MGLRFEWDPRKDRLNATKHGVRFEDARTAFADPLSVTIADPDHGENEVRFVLIGRSVTDHLVVVAHTERAETIRIISARFARRRERQVYEEGQVDRS